MQHQLNASSRIMYEEAQKMGILCTIFDDHETILMEKDGRQWYTRGSRTSFQSSVGKTIADKKSLTKSVLHHFNLPTAKSIAVTEETDLEKISNLSFPVVMKPVDGRHGQGVVIGIQNLAEAITALQESQSKSVVFEETLVGTEYRIVCVNYTFVAAAFRKPAFVTGDGTHTIEELVSIKNQHPWRGEGHQANLTFIKIDETVQHNLAELELTPQSIPVAGKEIFLRKTANLSTGGEAWDVTHDVCPENRSLFEKIAKACDLTIAGIDIMCHDLQSPITTQPQAGVIEINASPGLRMHHYPIQGEPINVAQHILNMTLSAASK